MKAATVVNIPDWDYLTIEGTGNPLTAQEYSDALDALHEVAATLELVIREKTGFDERAMPLESLWWTDGTQEFSLDSKGSWHWAVMIRRPEYVSKALLKSVCEQVKEEKNMPTLAKARLKPLHEGLSAEISRTGPSTAIGPTMKALHAFIKEHGYTFRGKHHEIYHDNPHRTTPKKLRVTIRQPVEHRHEKARTAPSLK